MRRAELARRAARPAARSVSARARREVERRARRPRTVAVPKRSWTVTSPPSRSAARRATATRVALDDQVELARRRGRAAASRTAPPTTQTPGSPASAASTGAAAAARQPLAGAPAGTPVT